MMFASAMVFSLLMLCAGDKYAIVVGVNKYQHARLPPLLYAVNDAQELAKFLSDAKYKVVELTDTSEILPTKDHIERAIADVLKKVTEHDTVLICLAGHGLQFEGSPDAYFCPRDARPFADQTDSLVSLTSIYKKLDRSFAGVKVMLVDACRDDPDAARGTRGGITSDSATPPRGVAALFSCSPGQRAFEHASIKHGVFFHYVLEGLRGKAANRENEISFADLSGYVQRNVSRNVKQIVGGNAQQAPNMIANLVGESPVLALAKKEADFAYPNMATVVPASNPKVANLPARPIKTTSNSFKMSMVLLPPLDFSMGAPDTDPQAERTEVPQHRVKITTPLWISAHEVTQDVYEKVMGTNPSQTKGPRLPVTHVSLLAACRFCNAMSYQEGFKQYYEINGDEITIPDRAADGYRLPTEAEWECACKANGSTRWHFGNDVAEALDYCWLLENAEQTLHEVGLKKPNNFGLYDMHGNVAEWCIDGLRLYKPDAVDDPIGSLTTSQRIVRGGSFKTSKIHARSTSRSKAPLTDGDPETGIRIVRNGKLD